MAIDLRLLALFGRRFPAIYDLIPRGPQQGRLGQVALNPQPLPPHELGAAVASEFIHSAWLSDRFGADPEAAFSDLDDWCPTVPRRPKLPPWWPPIPEPDPHPNWLADFHLGFSARLAGPALQYDGSRLGALFGKAIERSVAAMEDALGERQNGRLEAVFER